MNILSSTSLSQRKSEALFFNAHFSIPYIENKFIDYPDKQIKKLPLSTPVPMITFSITTCKRYELFEKTMNSFIWCCIDIHLISEWICVDDNSSHEDREKMKEKYPFFRFIWKTPEQKGHAQSMNMIMNNVKTPYLFHIEDDWQFYMPSFFMKQCLEVLNDNPTLGQCLINRNYAENAESGISIKGGFFQRSPHGQRYFIHEHETDQHAFIEKYGKVRNCAYWPHYSLQPSMNNVSFLKEVGTYNTNVPHFEMDFAHRYTRKGYKTAFLDRIACKHIGRLISERDTKPNAYDLNGQTQF